MEVAKISTSSVIPKRKKRRRLALLQLFIVVGFLALVWFSFGQNVLAPREQLDVPKQLGALELIGTVEGSEAMAQINRLHGLDIDLADAFVATYTHSSPYHGNSHATIWVGKVENAEAAAWLTQRMAESIEKGGSPFGNLRRMTVGDYEVFQVDGPGGAHFFYNSGKLREAVVWVTIEADDPLPILKEAVENF